jgi:hypothetical protein
MEGFSDATTGTSSGDIALQANSLLQSIRFHLDYFAVGASVRCRWEHDDLNSVWDVRAGYRSSEASRQGARKAKIQTRYRALAVGRSEEITHALAEKKDHAAGWHREVSR